MPTIIDFGGGLQDPDENCNPGWHTDFSLLRPRIESPVKLL